MSSIWQVFRFAQAQAVSVKSNMPNLNNGGFFACQGYLPCLIVFLDSGEFALHDASVLHGNLAVCEVGKVFVVGDDDECLPHLVT